ncbi:OLC1v1024709C1 [Oldenlandia corymbosa var. corymbosa]|uniref:OLC1v1024709C1 n=1 Tax=Oldenlandia corymbosa var. corymbosa TaxID=529605 RepID=A0AAV1C2Z7_OLDCO|nr:OLC1v1024709C1 [Oldenlandia corymbosa var. corymbosa]
MADGAVNYLLDKLTTILLQNASFLGDAQNEIEKIKLELESMKSFLREAELRREKSESVETWVRQVREVAIQVENILDEIIHYSDSSTNGAGGGKGVLKDFVHEAVNLARRLAATRRIYLKLQGIKAKVVEVSERSKRYAFDARVDDDWGSIRLAINWQPQQHQQLGELSSFVDVDDVVGMDEDQEILSKWLIENDTRRTVVSVVGMGGLGKTTLVTKVFNDQLIKLHFDSSAWISVSQNHEVEDLLRTMLKEFLKTEQAMSPGNLGSMKYRQLMEMLLEYLRCRRYLVVLDDVWSIDLWSRIRGAFPENQNGSRIVFTTRNQNVATSVGPGSRVHRLQPLQERDAWTLFRKRTFWNEHEHNCPAELEPLAKDILRKCEGLPLAIVAIAGLMCSKSRLAIEWKRVHASLNWQLSYNPILGRVKGILMLSFDDLPFYLKYCFLYCCVFPDDCFIKRKKLIRLWIAEGFILERKGMTLEEVAEDHLMELILRSMIQVQQVNDNGRVKTFHIHDVMRELAMTTSEKDNFCGRLDIRESKVARSVQHLSIDSRNGSVQMSKSTACQLRSLFVFGSDMCTSFSLNAVSPDFKFLRTLDLQCIPIEKLPNRLFDLFNLRFLNLRNTKVKDLPNSIGKLKNLQTLDIRSTNVEKLPRSIPNLGNLRHLFLGKSKTDDSRAPELLQALRAPARMGNLQNLQSLACVEAEEGLIKQLGCLTELRRLDMTKVKPCHGPKLCSSIGMLTNLHRLSLAASNQEQELSLEDLISAPPFLQKLELFGRLDRLPHWLASAQTLTHLDLEFSGLQDDFLPALHKLPALVFLQLREAYNGKILKFRRGGFLKLLKLHLIELSQLDCLEVEEGSLSSLKELSIVHCVALKQVPQGLEHISSLQKLRLEEMPELIVSLQTNVSEYREEVQHISTVDLVL